MKLTFRWYGDSDPVTLEKIRQIPMMNGIVTAIYSEAPGNVWRVQDIEALRKKINDNGLAFEVVESVPVPEEIKIGADSAKELIENYCENVRRLGKAGVKVICYNFMPVFDWLRSELERPQPDGANALAYDEQTVLSMNPLTSELSLPGWDESYGKNELKDLLNKYSRITEEDLWNNLAVFLKAVIPVAEEVGVKMAIHPDDPPWGIFGLPRIVTSKANLERLLSIVDSPSNGLTLCTGSLGADPNNDLCTIAKKFAKRIHFVHLRNVKITGERCFEEVAHPTGCGSVDMYGVIKALVDGGFDGYVRPDHGRMIWGETGRYGYGLFDRALGAAYIVGVFEAVEKCVCGENQRRYITDIYGNSVARRIGNEILDNNGNLVYKIEGSRILDKSGKLMYEVKGGKVFDQNGSLMYHLDGDKILDQNKNYLGIHLGGN